MARQIILLIEDEQMEGRSPRKMILERLRHHVILAHSGDEALELLERIDADCILLHSHTVGLSCKEVTAEIRRRFPQLRVVTLTPGITNLCGSTITIDSLRPHDLVHFIEWLV